MVPSIGLSELEEPVTLQEDLQSQPTWVQGSHRDGATNQRACRVWTLVPYTFVADVQFGLHVGPLTIGVGAVSDFVACRWLHFS